MLPKCAGAQSEIVSGENPYGACARSIGRLRRSDTRLCGGDRNRSLDWRRARTTWPASVPAQNDDSEEAVGRLRTVLAQSPEQIAARLLLATVLERCGGNVEGAKTELQRALDFKARTVGLRPATTQLHLRTGK